MPPRKFIILFKPIIKTHDLVHEKLLCLNKHVHTYIHLNNTYTAYLLSQCGKYVKVLPRNTHYLLVSFIYFSLKLQWMS